jgi:hypothetical protein
LVSQFCENLHKRENAHSILFLTHHSKDPWVIDQLSATLTRCFEDNTPISFEQDVGTINELIDSASHLLLGEVDIDKNQEKMRKLRDKLENGTNDTDTQTIEAEGHTELIEAGHDTAPTNDTREQVEFVGKRY